MTSDVDTVVTRRKLPYWAFAIVVLVYLAIIQVGGVISLRVAGVDAGMTTTTQIVAGMLVPLSIALAFTYGVVAWLGWLQPVLHDDHPISRWVIVVPIIFAVCIAVAVDYAALADKTFGFVLALFIATQLVGWGEEGMFRGIGVVMMRDHGLTEGKVAFWSSVIFGAAHLSNAVGRGAGAIEQAVAVSFAGYFFYLTRRRTRGNVVNSVLHGLFDFSLLTGTAILVDQGAYPGAAAGILAYLVTGVVLLIKRHDIEPGPDPIR